MKWVGSFILAMLLCAGCSEQKMETPVPPTSSPYQNPRPAR
jgi:hypothetical protein